MEHRIQNTSISRSDDSFENMLLNHSDHIFSGDERPLTSTGRRRRNITPSEDGFEQSFSLYNNRRGSNNEEDGDGRRLIIVRFLLPPMLDDEPAQGLPQEMIDKIRRMKMGKSGKDCTICYNGFKQGEKIRRLPCKHIFHDSCILPWLENNITCPNCRMNLFEYFVDHPEGNYK